LSDRIFLRLFQFCGFPRWPRESQRHDKRNATLLL
jgi:hypothetical protein